MFYAFTKRKAVKFRLFFLIQCLTQLFMNVLVVNQISYCQCWVAEAEADIDDKDDKDGEGHI